MLMGMSAAEPTFRWDMRIESSPGGRQSLGYLGAKEDCARPATCLLLTLFPLALTCDPGGEGAAGNVLLVVFDQDAVVTRKHRQVRDATRPILVVSAADFCFGWALDGQGQAPWRESRVRVETAFRDTASMRKSPDRQADVRAARQGAPFRGCLSCVQLSAR